MTELRLYRTFLEIAHRGSFTAAAESLYMTQSAVSEQMARLEKDLHVRLLERGRNGARLTVAGRRLYDQAQQLVRLASEIERSAKAGEGAETILRVGATMGPFFSHLPEVLLQLQVEFEIKVIVRDSPTAETLLQVGLGQLDLGIVSLPTRSKHDDLFTGVERVVLAEEDWVILAPAGHPIAEQKSVPLVRLIGEPLVLFPSNYALRQVLDEFLTRAGVSIEPTIETGWLDKLYGCVRLGLGLSIVPRAVGQNDMEGIAVLEVEGPDAPRRVLTAFYSSDSPKLPVIERLLELLRQPDSAWDVATDS